MQSDIVSKVVNIGAFVDKVEQRTPIAVAEHKTKMTERINEVISGVAFDEARLLNEIAFIRIRWQLMRKSPALGRIYRTSIIYAAGAEP